VRCLKALGRFSSKKFKIPQNTEANPTIAKTPRHKKNCDFPLKSKELMILSPELVRLGKQSELDDWLS
jgi:hypothetical protein